MNFPNEVSCSIFIDPRDLGNVVGCKNSIDIGELTVLPDWFHPISWVAADTMMEFARTRRAAREDGIGDSRWTDRLDDGLANLASVLRDHNGWGPDRPYDANAFGIGDGPRDERLVCRDPDGFADAGELAEENARLYGSPSVAGFAEAVWGCTCLEPIKVRHFSADGFRGLEFSFREAAETRMRAWQFDACPKAAAALAAALTYRCERGFYMEAGCPGDEGGIWGLSYDRKEPGSYAVAKFHPERATYDPHGKAAVSRCPILLEHAGDGTIDFRHPGTVPDRLVDNFIPAMKRCDVYGGGPTPEAARGTEGVTVGAVRPGDTRIAFPTLAERAQAAALATARGATTAAGHRL